MSVRHTSCGADVVILGGDLNMHPQDLGNRLIRAHTGLRDCYTETDTFDVSSHHFACTFGLMYILLYSLQ